MSEFLKSNPQIDKIILDAAAGGFENMREQMLQGLVKQGALKREAGGFGVRVQPQDSEPESQATPDSSVSAAPDRFVQVLYPSGNDRLVVCAPTAEALAAKISAIEQIYKTR